jgi:hypothetical protein
MRDSISVKVTCPYCGKKVKTEKQIDFAEYTDWDRITSDFDVEEFHCSCGETFLGAETAQSKKVEKVVTIAKELKEQGKFDITKTSIKINLGLSDIWKLIRELKDLEGDFK